MGHDAAPLFLAAERTELMGVRISAVLLFLLGCFSGFCALFLAGLLGAEVSWVWKGRQSKADGLHLAGWLLIVVVVCAGAAYLCIKAAPSLREARVWAAYVAMAIGLLFLLFPAFFAYLLFFFHPEQQAQAPDDYFVILIVPFLCFLFVVGLWWCIYLNLPHVRAYFREGSSK